VDLRPDGAASAPAPAGAHSVPLVAPSERPEDGLPPAAAGSEASLARALDLLTEGELHIEGQLIHGSNHTFLARVEDAQTAALAIYKPRRGERPLWDFPGGTLCQREVAAFQTAQALGWPFVPPTILREGELGMGMAQLFVPHDPEEHFLIMEQPSPRDVARLVAFDIVINNADRKSGHVLRSADDRLWAIDHGVAFHVEPKLRTVIWQLAGDPLPEDVQAGLRRLLKALATRGPELAALAPLLDTSELDALRERAQGLLEAGSFPAPDRQGRAIPWPPV
jgi:hypothetical protein